MSVEAKLTEAIQAGEILNIVYHGGSQPGKSRKIAPISISNGKVRARCYSSNAVKMFNVEKIEVLSDTNVESNDEWMVGRGAIPHFKTLQQVLDENKNRLKKLGWVVNIDESNLTLHRKFKNGKVLKTKDVQLYYEEYSTFPIIGLDGEIIEEEVKKRTRPYGVRAKEFNTKTFGVLDNAVPVFLEQAEYLSPLKK